MTLQITRINTPKNLFGVKCPYTMTPTRIVVHNTANKASAMSEISYMLNNTNEVSYHFAVDYERAVQGIPLNKNTWNAGDGGNGIGNRQGIAIEICHSTGNADDFVRSEKNGAILVAMLLKQYGWGIEKVTKHQDYSGKYCPHKTLDMGWQRFLNMVNKELSGSADVPSSTPTPSKTVDQLAQEVINGAWGNNPARREALEAAGYDYNAIQARVNEMCGGSAAPKPSGKSIDQLAQEVINGAWGNNPARREALEAAGYDYNAIQARVNQLLG